jgi:hypothetical protein
MISLTSTLSVATLRYFTDRRMLPNDKNLNNFSQFSLRAISLFILDINSYMGKIGGSVERYVPPMGIR